MTHSLHVDLLARTFRPGGQTVRQILAAELPAVVTPADLAAAAAALGPADLERSPVDPWGDARSAREGSR